jgi:hypothetical protein
MRKLLPILIVVTIFSIAMAYLETAVVIYLRELLYPGGFKFPLAPMPGRLALTEILRELATIMMLIGAGALAGKTFSQRFAWFIYAFGIWDIFFYVFLKILTDWPESLMTWDLLFLIPTTWTGPVISPVIVSLTMISLAMVILNFSTGDFISRIDITEWILLISGSLVLITGFTWDYTGYILERFSFREIWMIPDKEMIYSTAYNYIPREFNWILFISGETIVVFTIFRYYRRCNKLFLNGFPMQKES